MNAPDTDRCPNCFSVRAATPCPQCGWQPGLDNPPPALALGTVLDGRYRIGRVLGHGGFGITYLAWDENLHLRLAIKEYLPRDTATRAPDGVSMAIYSGQAGEQFAYGLERFIDEARALARFDQHPGIVTVKNFFRTHGTGYCVMDYVEGITLRHYLDQQPGGKISVEAALKLLTPVADALRAVHKEGLLHRDIAPDNIYLSQDGRIKLLDFGAARYAAGEHSKSLSMVLKPGYSPEEQYRTKGRQGPWTDVYGLGATVYRAITGTVPPESLDRLDHDDLVPPSKLGIAIQPEQEAALLKALAVKAHQRYQSIPELQSVFAPWLGINQPAPTTRSISTNNYSHKRTVASNQSPEGNQALDSETLASENAPTSTSIMIFKYFLNYFLWFLSLILTAELIAPALKDVAPWPHKLVSLITLFVIVVGIFYFLIRFISPKLFNFLTSDNYTSQSKFKLWLVNLVGAITAGNLFLILVFFF